jgi:hypothetical protein
MPVGREYLGSDADAVIRRFRPQVAAGAFGFLTLIPEGDCHRWTSPPVLLVDSIWGRSFFASAIVFLLPPGEFNIF